MILKVFDNNFPILSNTWVDWKNATSPEFLEKKKSACSMHHIQLETWNTITTCRLQGHDGRLRLFVVDQVSVRVH